MNITLSFIQAAILLGLSAIHFNWAFGGKFGFDKALPTNAKDKKVLNPTKFDSAIVAIGLLLFAVYYLFIGEFLTFYVPSYMLAYAGWAISGIFLLRAIGDFKYIGFFKRIKETEFSELDSRYYSPLCLVLGLNGLVLEIL